MSGIAGIVFQHADKGYVKQAENSQEVWNDNVIIQRVPTSSGTLLTRWIPFSHCILAYLDLGL